jgi:3-oxoacyl-[acyl-carrier-protein] synthase-1
MGSPKRVVVTGLGIVSSIGNDIQEVERSLRDGRSGMVFMPEMKKLGYRCCVFAPVRELDLSGIRGKGRQTMSTAASYAVIAALEALRDGKLSLDDLAEGIAGPDTEVAVVVGTAAGGVSEVPWAEDTRRQQKSTSRLGGAGVVRIMNSTASGNLAALLRIRGRACSLSAACATGLYNIGYAYELIKHGTVDLCICGSAEEDLWRQVGLSGDNSDGMPTDYNDRPTQACRPYDRDRQGFVISAGAGILILEEHEHARSRGARIYAEVVGYGAANDGEDLFVPSGDGLRRAIDEAMRSTSEWGVHEIDYINSHGAGTIAGDRVEAEALASIFGRGPIVSSTKGASGHSQGATASQEAVFTALMLHHGFVAPTKNLENIAPECDGVRHAQLVQDVGMQTAMTVNSGLGGANACLVLKKL